MKEVNKLKKIKTTKLFDMDLHDIITSSGEYRMIATKKGKQPKIAFEGLDKKINRLVKASKKY
jgi:hypothetical protein